VLGGGGTAGYIFKDKIIALFNGDESHGEEEHGDSDELADNDHADEHADDTSEHDETMSDSSDVSNEEIVNEDDATAENTDEVAEEIVEEVVEEVVETPEVTYSSTGGNYHVIGNAFSDASNADNYVNQMKSQGYSSAKVLGKFDNLHMVSIQQFDSRSSAASAASKAGDGAWVFKWPK
jgi:hypothetical protein